MSLVIMNSLGQFAYISIAQTHSGTKHKLRWVELNKATVFPYKPNKRDYSDIYNELVEGIPVGAKEHRTVTLTKL